MRFTPRAAAEQADQDHETVLRVRAAMDAYWASHGPGGMVAVSHVRDLLDPRGMWSYDPGERGGPGPGTPQGQPQVISPTADPITGCEPVTAPGADPGYGG